MFQCGNYILRQIVKQNRWTLANGNRTFSVGITSLSDEVQKAKNAAQSVATNTIFDQIIDKKISVNTLYEDEKCMAFQDTAPQAPVHFLVIPKQRIDMLENVTQKDQNVIDLVCDETKINYIIGVESCEYNNANLVYFRLWAI